MVALGSKDAPLTGDPEITFFKIVYKKHTLFAIQQIIKNLGAKNFNTYNSYKIDKTGDLLLGMYFKISISDFSIIKTNTNINNTSYFDINNLEIYYNNNDAFIFYYLNCFYVVPKYMTKLYNYNNSNLLISNNTVISNLIPELIDDNNIVESCYIYDLLENPKNSILSLLRKYTNYFEDYYLNLISTSYDYEYNNQLITTKSYINYLNTKITNSFYDNYNYYNNIRSNKKYYNFTEIKQYLLYVNSLDNNFINQDNYDVDIVYNYCIKNNITNYLFYQQNAILFNSIFIYNILLQLYPVNTINFTFWKKYNLLGDNKPDLNFVNNTFNTFGEWTNNLNATFNSQLINLIPFQQYKQNYSIAENNINQLFNLLIIDNPQQLFIILSTFINQYNKTTKYINFDDYNSATNTNILNNKINEQLNNYTTLISLNSSITINSIANELTIYPVDLMILYPFLAYKLIDTLANLQLFTNTMFLIFWRNKINNFYFLNYQQNYSSNLSNTYLYDSYEINRKLTFYTNFNIKNILFLSDIKQYFLNLFYSNSFFGFVNFNSIETYNFIQSTNTINIKQIQSSLNESEIKNFNKLKIINKYYVDYKILSNTIIISNWYNNYNVNTIFYITSFNNNYYPTSFSVDNFILTLTFDYLPIIDNTLNLIVENNIDLPLVNLADGLIPQNNFFIFNIFSKTNNLITNDNILSLTNLFRLNNLLINIDNTINNYIFYFKVIVITIKNEVFRYFIEIENSDGYYKIISNNNELYDKNEITNIDIEFIEIKYRDIGTKDGNTITNNTFVIEIQNNWVWDINKTYWLYGNQKYLSLRYENGNFIVNDKLEPIVYIIREIDNTSLPSFYNYLNYYENSNLISDLMDFFMQTPMIFLLKGQPYLYFYNIPYNIDSNTELYLNNKLVTWILPINSNQFFGKKVSTLFDREILLNNLSLPDLITLMSTQFDSIFYQSTYLNIINVLENAKKILIELNTTFLNNNYGKTTNEIITNINKINNYDLLNYTNINFSNSNNLVLELYGNTTILSNKIIQGLNVQFYNYPYTSYLPNRKISSDLLNYLNSIPTFFEEQILYINSNIDYYTITNPNQYNETYSSIGDIWNQIDNVTYNYNGNSNITLLYPMDNINFNSMYYNNNQISISSIVSYNEVIAHNFNSFIYNDDQYTTEIYSNETNTYNQNKFNYLGLILYANGNIYFTNKTNKIDISNYNYVLLDDNQIVKINNNRDPLNIIYKNAYLLNIIDLSNNVNFVKCDNYYYYLASIDISNNLSLYNCLIYNNSIYYLNYLNNRVEIFSNQELNLYNNDYLIGSIAITNIIDLFNSSLLDITNIQFIRIKLNIIKSNTVNYYSQNNFINTFYDQVIINNYRFIYLDTSNTSINLNQLTYNTIKLPPINKNFVFYNGNEDLFYSNQNNFLIKMDKYIINYYDLSKNILLSDNYNLSVLPIELPNLISYDISGYINITNCIEIYFYNLLNIPINCYYKINGSYIYLSDISNYILINDNNLIYYNLGSFDKIYLLDNSYFKNSYPNIINYDYINLSENLIGQLNGNIIYDINNKVVDSLFTNNSNTIINYDLSSIYIDSQDEKEILLSLLDTNTNINFMRPIIIKNKENKEYPNITFLWNNNNENYNNSLVILNVIPDLFIPFLTLNISFSQPIISIKTLESNINIFSNINKTSNSISFNNTIGLINNKYYKWKLLINDIYPIYFWTLFTINNFIYTTDILSEPIYINQSNINLFRLTANIKLIGGLPNIIVSNNNLLQLNTNLYYSNKSRKLTNEYYNDSLFIENLNYDIKLNNFCVYDKYIPDLLFLNKLITTNFTKTFIQLDAKSIEILKNAKYLIIQNNNIYYTKVINILDNGIYLENINLNINYPIGIYYSYSDIYFRNNNIILTLINNKYKIVTYEFNDLKPNEIIYIHQSIFQVIGLNSLNNYYDIKLLNNVPLSKFNHNGYYSFGLINTKSYINYPKIINNEPLIYILDTYNLVIGDYYFVNNIFKPKTTPYLEPDLFSYNKSGTEINIIIKNKNIYLVNEFDMLNQNDILVYNNIIYHIKCIINYQIFLNETLNLSDAEYTFYYPYQPFNGAIVNINSLGQINSLNQINLYDFIELDNVFYLVSEIPTQYYNKKNIYARIANVQKSKLYFENNLFFNKYINKIILDYNTVVYINNCEVIDQYTIKVLNNNIINLYLFYYQPIRIGSIINFVKSVLYRDTIIIIKLFNKIELINTNLEVYLSPLGLYVNKYYSIYNIDQFRSPKIEISNNIICYNIENNKLINILTKQNSYIKNNICFVDNYTQIDSNNRIIKSSLQINSYHLLLEITPEKDYFVHLIKIVYPHNIYFYSQITNNESEFYLDKINKIVINLIDNSFIFDETNYYKKNSLLYKIDPINIWYKYPITPNGVPIYKNGKFQLEILNGNIYLGQQIYLSENSTNVYEINLINGRYYLISNIYLGNNMSYIYLKNINYIKYNIPQTKTFKEYLINHNDQRLNNILSNNIINEKIINNVIIELDTIGDQYKYKLYDLKNNIYNLENATYYNIGDPYLLINQNYIYNGFSYIFTDNQIINVSNNITSLFNDIVVKTEIFDQINLSKTVPEIVSKMKLDSHIEKYMILNQIKPWTTWTILSATNLNEIQQLVNRGNIIYTGQNIYQDTSNIYFTNNELKYFSDYLKHPEEQNKINIQLKLLDIVINNMDNLINDSSFWFNVPDRINQLITDLSMNCYFNGSFIVFYNEDVSSNKIFDLINNKRRYTLNNEYIQINNTITRNYDTIGEQVNYLLNNKKNESIIGIELNDLLKLLNEYGNYYIKLFDDIYQTEDKQLNYFNATKLLVTHIWNNYKNTLDKLNSDFNLKMNMTYNISNSSNNIINYFTNNFEYIKTNMVDVSNEVFINDYYVYNNLYVKTKIDWKLDTNPIYPYYIYFSKNVIIPQVVYQINFYNLSYELSLFDLQEYPTELDLYLDNDYDNNIDYSVIGITYYNTVSTYLGQLYLLQNNLDYSLVDYITYKNTKISIYKYDSNYAYLASLINLEINNYLEIIKNVGIKIKVNNYIIFYQSNFNYVENNTYINYNNIYYPLNKDISGNYYTDQILNLPETIMLVILYNINNYIKTTNYIYSLQLDKSFSNYKDYIDSEKNIIPINFKLNNTIIPNEIIFYSDYIIVANVNEQVNINTLAHYANIGETPAIQINSLIKLDYYLYNTNETYDLKSNSTLWLSDSSNYYLGDLCSIDNLDISDTIKFIIPKLYNQIEITTKNLYIENNWNITNYIYDPNNQRIAFDYPLDLNFSNQEKYSYKINTNNLTNSQIYINGNQLYINYSISGSISGPISFSQTYKSSSKVNKPIYNQMAQVNLLYPYQYYNDVYFLPLDIDGNSIGSLLYKIILSNELEPNNLTILILISNKTYIVNILYWLNNREIIIGTNENLLLSLKYYIQINNYIYNVDSISYYQDAYQQGIFYYQDNINNFNIFVNEKSNSFDFTNQLNTTKYYIHSHLVKVSLTNIFNPRQFSRSDSMKISVINTNIQNTIIEKPLINKKNIFKSISLFLGDQLLETLNFDIYDIIYNFYATTEMKNHINNVFKLIYNENGWELYMPLLFWFYYNSTLAIPLISLPYTDLHLKYDINNIQNILMNDLTNSKFSRNPEINIEIVLDTILLDTPERQLFGSHQHEYIIERFTQYPNNLIYKDTQTVNLNYNNLVKDMFWITKPIYHKNITYYENISWTNDKHYNYYLVVLNEYNKYNITQTYTTNNIIYTNDFLILKNINIEIYLNSSNRVKIIKSDIFFDNYDLTFILFYMDKYLVNLNFKTQILNLKLYFIHTYKHIKNVKKINPIKTINIQSNGVDLVKKYDYMYYNSIIPYNKFHNSPEVGFYTYTFSLDPTNRQPSGHLNFNHLDNVVLNIESSISDNSNEPYNLVSIVKEYQILRIMSGQGSLAWSN